jgi:transposase-like protein
MEENKALALVARPKRRYVGREERERILAQWARSGARVEEMAEEAGVSCRSLSQWKRADVPKRRVREAFVEVPAPMTAGMWAAEATTRCGLVRFSCSASPAWAGQLLRELTRC